MNSPTRGLEKLKLKNGYVNRGSAGPRRPASPRPLSRPESRNNSAGGSDGKGKVVGSGGGLERVTSKSGGEDELVGGWPKWLTDNIPREALAGLVPRSAETYDKLDKVSLTFIYFFGMKSFIQKANFFIYILTNNRYTVVSAFDLILYIIYCTYEMHVQ